MEWLAPIVITIFTAATPLVLAATGEIVVERSGVLNLGVEGMMIVGAIIAFVVSYEFGSTLLGFVSGGIAGMGMAALFGFMVLILRTSQVPTGLALTLFGIGLSALIGTNYAGISLDSVAKGIIFLRDLPIVGTVIFGHDPMVYIAILLVAFTSWWLFKTRIGLVVRAIGEDHDAAHALGYRIILVRFMCVLYGGLFAGIAGAYLSLIYTPLWAENMTAGRGWIALALVVFATWRPWWGLLGACLFGGFTILQFHIQGSGINIASQYLSMLPYLVTIIVLVWSSSRNKNYLGAPACLGKSFTAS